MKPLPQTFFHRDPHELARALLGKQLVREIDGERLTGRIVELEVYGGQDDPACHADSGTPTDRTRSMFGEPGLAYVYRIYGMYDCLNVVAPRGEQGKAAAILIRAVAPEQGLLRMAKGRGLDVEGDFTRRQRRALMSGPGKLCQALHVDRDLDGHLLTGSPLFVADGDIIEPGRVETTSRIGLNPKTCGDSTHFPWRYIVADSPFLSR